jgi:uncharacterized membrane protein YphA (DoxX/SURF4 family)
MKKLTTQKPGNAAPFTRRLVFLRMALGILLCINGYDFINNTTSMQGLQVMLIQQQNLTLPIDKLSLAVGWTQLIGGLFIVLGLFTRMACLVQLPVVTIILLIKFSTYTLSDVTLLEIIIAFSGLTLFLEKGGGKLSLDRLFRFNQSDRLVFWA